MKKPRIHFLLLAAMTGFISVNLHAVLMIDPMIFVTNHEELLHDQGLMTLYEEFATSIGDGTLSGIEVHIALHDARQKAAELYVLHRSEDLMVLTLSLYSLELFTTEQIINKKD